MRATDLLAAALAALVACASEPVPVGGDAPSTAPIVVRLVGDGFVDVDGARMTLDDLVYDLRVRCREAAGDPDRTPWLRVLADADAPPDVADAIARLRQEAYDAGVRHLELGGG